MLSFYFTHYLAINFIGGSVVLGGVLGMPLWFAIGHLLGIIDG